MPAAGDEPGPSRARVTASYSPELNTRGFCRAGGGQPAPSTGQEQKAQELPAACSPASWHTQGPASAVLHPPVPAGMPTAPQLNQGHHAPTPALRCPFPPRPSPICSPRRGANGGTLVWHRPTSAPRAAGTGRRVDYPAPGAALWAGVRGCCRCCWLGLPHFAPGQTSLKALLKSSSKGWKRAELSSWCCSTLPEPPLHRGRAPMAGHRSPRGFAGTRRENSERGSFDLPLALNPVG